MVWVGLTVFSTILLVGLVVIAVVHRKYTVQLERLAQHQKFLQDSSARTGAGSVFLTAGSQATNPKLVQLLIMAGLEDQYSHVKLQWIYTSIGCGVVFAGIALTVIHSNVIPLFFVGTMLGAGGYLVYLKTKGTNRQNKITRQLPQVLDSMSSTLKAGSSITEVFKSAAEISPEPIRSEFSKACSQVQLNKSLAEVIEEMSQRITTRDFKFFVQAVSISQSTGSDLADAIAGIAENLRDKFRLRDLVSSLTAQGKITAGIVGFLPYGMMLFFGLSNFSYIEPLVTNPIAQLIICGLILWECLGIFILMKIVSYEV